MLMLLITLKNKAKNHISGAKKGFISLMNLFLVLIVTVVTVASVQAKSMPDTAIQSTISVAELPKQGQNVYVLIAQGGPFEYDKDGVVFGNREQLLPKQKRGYYREYTVKTSGSKNRGARRIVCGGLQAHLPEACYYTDDHYASFRKIVR
jgi:ribonuclease T1